MIINENDPLSFLSYPVCPNLILLASERNLDDIGKLDWQHYGTLCSATKSIGAYNLRKDMCPKDDEDLSQRALFFSTALALFCSKMLRDYIDYCEAPLLKKSARTEIPYISKKDFQNSVKELLSICLWETLLEESANEIPDWFKTFIVRCHEASEGMIPVPSGKEVMARYDFTEGIQQVFELVSFNICTKLKLGYSCEDALVRLGTMFSASRQERTGLLNFALTEPLGILQLEIQAEAIERQ